MSHCFRFHERTDFFSDWRRWLIKPCNILACMFRERSDILCINSKFSKFKSHMYNTYKITPHGWYNALNKRLDAYIILLRLGVVAYLRMSAYFRGHLYNCFDFTSNLQIQNINFVGTVHYLQTINKHFLWYKWNDESKCCLHSHAFHLVVINLWDEISNRCPFYRIEGLEGWLLIR